MTLLNTFTSYQLITKDINKSIDRIEQQPTVDRDTKYYLANITKVKSIDDFVNNDRLFKFAMKAYGLEDMDYAKAFMVKALKEGVTDPNSFANKLTDKRYAQFVSAFNFAANGADATIYNKAQQLVTKNYATQAQIAGLDPNSDYVKGETTYYLANITKVKSVDDLMSNSRLYTYALAAFGLDSATENKDLIKQVLQGGVRDPNSVANKQKNPAYAALASAFNFEQYGEAATTINPAQQPTVDKYMRQTLEEDAGKTNEGVRLALYFQRKAPDITSWYDVLADTALASVVRTALGLPDSFATADIDKQAQLFEQKLDISDFTDPVKLGKFLTRFTSMYEINNPTSTAVTSVSVLFAQPVTAGISTDLMMAMQKLKF
ncbi:putative peroxiredoxin [Mesorhizobium jarvisii]|jgi:predicted peroxiredoxin